MQIQNEIPVFTYALTDSIIKHTPCELDGKKIKAEDFLPSRSDDKSTGYDVRCAAVDLITMNDGTVVKGIELFPYCQFKLPLGFRAYIPDGWWLRLTTRSSTFTNLCIDSLDGTIDETYPNLFYFVGRLLPNNCDLLTVNKRFIVKFGQRIAQLIPTPRYEQQVKQVSNDELDKMFVERNAVRKGGFGSTGVA